MPATLILSATAMGLVLVVLALVVVGIRQEPPAQELTGHVPRLIARLARRLLGVYVRRRIHLRTRTSSTRNRAVQHTVPPAHRTDTPEHRSATSDRAPSGMSA